MNILQSMLNQILEISLSMSIVISVLLLLRHFLGKRYRTSAFYWIWLFVAIRLVIPFNITLPDAPMTISVPENIITYSQPADTENFSPENFTNPAPTQPNNTQITLPPIQIEDNQQGQSEKPVLPQSEKPTTNTPEKSPLTVSQILALVWISGAIVFLTVNLISYALFRRKIHRFKKQYVDLETNLVFKKLRREIGVKNISLAVCPLVPSPLVSGFIRPTLLLPKEDYTVLELEAIFRHELVHAKRHDLWYKLLLLFARTLHWFNPLVHIMAHRADNDMEISCDEKVVYKKSEDFKTQYAQAILSVVEHSIALPVYLTTHLKSGKKTMKQRLTVITSRKIKRKGILIISLVAVLAILITAACSINNGDETSIDETVPQTEISYKIEGLPSEAVDYMLRDDFLWNGIMGVTFKTNWIDNDRILFYTSTNDLSKSACRKFSYSVKDKNITQICDSGSSKYVYPFTYNNNSYLLDLDGRYYNLHNIASLTSEKMEGVDFGEVSKFGDTVIISGHTATIKEILNPNSKTTSISLTRNFDYAKWSPDGKYLAFGHNVEKGIVIYTRDGLFVRELDCHYVDWCYTSGFLGFYNTEDTTYYILNIRTGEKTALQGYSSVDRVVLEPDFALLRKYTNENPLCLINHKTGEEIEIEIANEEFLIDTRADYNLDTNTISLACVFEDETDGYKVWIDAYLISLESRVKIDNDTQNNTSLVNTAIASNIQKVLSGSKEFIYLGEQPSGDRKATAESIKIDKVPALVDLKNQKYASLDLDGDSENEVVIQYSNDDNLIGQYLVLHQIGDDIYGYGTSYQYFIDLKTDGTFTYSLDVGINTGSATVSFTKEEMILNKIFSAYQAFAPGTPTYTVNGKDATEQEYLAAQKSQSQKQSVEWQNSYDFKNNADSSTENTAESAVKVEDIQSLNMILSQTWNNGDEIGVHRYYAYYLNYINSVMTPEERNEKYPNGFPEEEFEAFIKSRFDVSTEHLRSDENTYHPETKTYHIQLEAPNLFGRVEFSDSDVSKDGKIFVVRAKYFQYTTGTTYEIREYRLKKDGDHFKYLSCVKVDNTTPNNTTTNSIQDVLLGKGQFKYVGEASVIAEFTNAEATLGVQDVPSFFIPYDDYAKIYNYALIDLDGDNKNEAVLYVCGVAGDMSKYIVLHEINGTVYGYSVNYRYFQDLKTDGTFTFSDPFDSFFSFVNVKFTEKKMIFNEIFYARRERFSEEPYSYIINNVTTVNDLTEEEFKNVEQKQSQKPNATWLNFPEFQSNTVVNNTTYIETNPSISQEDKEKALMYIDTLGSIAYDLGWDENYELPPRSLVKWYVYRTYNKDTISSYLSENKASYCFNKQEVENEVFKYFDTPQLTSLLEFSEKYEVSSAVDFSHLPQKSLKLNYVEKSENSFKLYFTITQNGLDVSRDMLLTVRESDDGFKFVSYVPNTLEIDESLLKDTIRYEFGCNGNNGLVTQMWINLPKSWTKDDDYRMSSPNGFTVYFHMITRFEGLQDYSQIFKNKDEYYATTNTLESGRYNYSGQLGKYYLTKDNILHYVIYTEYKCLSLEVYVDYGVDVNKARAEFEKYLPTLEIGKCTQW